MIRALPLLIVGAVPLASFLALSIQPLMGKLLLPVYGGTSATWLGTMLYFQLALLLGYAWAAWLVRQRAIVQVTATTVLALLAVLTFHLPSGQIDTTPRIAIVVWRLAVSTLPAMALLFGTSPLLHGWLRQRGQEVPYYLYAISNAGSLVAVLFYPFVIEPSLGITEQTLFWRGILAIVAGLLALAGYIILRTSAEASDRPAPEGPAEVLSPGLVAIWLGLSALTCIGMLGATFHLASEIGSNPLAWAGPFGVYLLSFTVTFSERWRRWMTMTTTVWLAVSLAGFMVTKGFTAATVNAWTAWWLLSLTASGSFLGNALLHSLRPAQRFERYYLILAAGSVLGGLLSVTVIPQLFARPVEFVLASVALLTTGMLWLTGRRESSIAIVTASVLLAPVIGLGLHQAGLETATGARVHHLRDLYGHVMITLNPQNVVLSNDTTTHGSQFTADAAARRRPTLYYTESTGVGRVLERLQADRPTMRVGVIGLGAGILSTYARKDDTYDFWDIDPKVIRIAREYFTFVAESAGQINLVQRDGRQALAESRSDYDVLILDAFTGDGIPSQLLTREALALYHRRLTARDGLLLVNASTRYSKLFPVVEATARSLGQATIDVVTDISASTNNRDWDPTHTEYLIVCRLERLKEISGWFAEEEDKGRVKHKVTTVEAPLVNPQLIWSDDRNAALDTLELGRFLFEP
jgi:predicted membrane-bound spermidine synthase